MRTRATVQIPEHHKNLAKHLRERFGEPASIVVYRDEHGTSPVPIGHFGPPKNCFFSTIGICDMLLGVPKGQYELAASGHLTWLPNAIASSIYWLRDRECQDWPLVCEDVVKHNATSTYRHLGYVPSVYTYQAPLGPAVKWLLGVPLRDSEISLDLKECIQKARRRYPSWFFEEGT